MPSYGSKHFLAPKIYYDRRYLGLLIVAEDTSKLSFLGNLPFFAGHRKDLSILGGHSNPVL